MCERGCKIRGSFAQDLVRLTQFANFTLQFFEARKLITGRPRSLTGIALFAPHPLA
jgi:hypothetical protein